MPNKCSVSGCRSNYRGTEYVSSFQFPGDEGRRSQWLKAIPTEFQAITENMAVCIKHFAQAFIKIRTGENSRPRLTDDAVPTLFPNLPRYLSVEPPAKRKSPEEREELAYSNWFRTC